MQEKKLVVIGKASKSSPNLIPFHDPHLERMRQIYLCLLWKGSCVQQGAISQITSTLGISSNVQEMNRLMLSKVSITVLDWQ